MRFPSPYIPVELNMEGLRYWFGNDFVDELEGKCVCKKHNPEEKTGNTEDNRAESDKI